MSRSGGIHRLTPLVSLNKSFMKTRALQKYIYVTITWEIHSNIYIYFQSIYVSHITISRKTYTYIIYSLTLFLLCIHNINSFIHGRCRCNFKSTIFRGVYTISISSERYNDAIMSVMAYQITGILIVCSTVCSGADHRKYQSSVTGLCEGNPLVTSGLNVRLGNGLLPDGTKLLPKPILTIIKHFVLRYSFEGKFTRHALT